MDVGFHEPGLTFMKIHENIFTRVEVELTPVGVPVHLYETKDIKFLRINICCNHFLSLYYELNVKLILDQIFIYLFQLKPMKL